MDESGQQTIELDPIACPSARGLRMQAALFSGVSVLVVGGLSVNCVFAQQGVQWWHVVLVLVPILTLHLWFAWRIGRRTIRLLNDFCIVDSRFGPFHLSQTFAKHTLTGVRLSHHTDNESSDRWMIQLQSQKHTRSAIYFVTRINRFGQYPDWQPIVIAYNQNDASTLCSRIAEWANLPFAPAPVA